MDNLLVLLYRNDTKRIDDFNSSTIRNFKSRNILNIVRIYVQSSDSVLDLLNKSAKYFYNGFFDIYNSATHIIKHPKDFNSVVSCPNIKYLRNDIFDFKLKEFVSHPEFNDRFVLDVFLTEYYKILDTVDLQKLVCDSINKNNKLTFVACNDEKEFDFFNQNFECVSIGFFNLLEDMINPVKKFDYMFRMSGDETKIVDLFRTIRNIAN